MEALPLRFSLSNSFNGAWVPVRSVQIIGKSSRCQETVAIALLPRPFRR